MTEQVSQLHKYMRDNQVEEMVQQLVECILRDKPTDPKQYIVEKLSAESSSASGGRRASVDTINSSTLNQLLQATKAINNEIVPKETINIVIRETCKLLHCDRATLFVFDKRLGALVVLSSVGAGAIRIKPGQGIAGHVFASKQLVNIKDCYKDLRFDPSHDKATGYHTESLLAVPVTNFEHEAVAVLQAINKHGGAFTPVDEVILSTLGEHAGIALRNAEVYKEALAAGDRANGLIRMIKSLTQDLGTQSTILTITTHAGDLVSADRCTVFIVDNRSDELWSISTDSGKEIRIPKALGIAGDCATKGEIMNVPDAYADTRFNQEFDKVTGYRTQSVLALPIKDEKGSVLGVIQMINRKEVDGEVVPFSDDDVQVMETFCTLVGAKLQSSSLVHQLQGGAKLGEAAKAFGGSPTKSGERKLDIAATAIAEGDEEADA